MDDRTDQTAYWNGPQGERWVREREATDRAFSAFAEKLLGHAAAAAALVQGARVLDVGCGCGTTTLAAADAAGSQGTVVGVDLSAPMIACARQRSLGRPNVAYVLADASEHAFDTTFDTAISRFGVMFFRQPVLAFARLCGVLRPGGSLTFVCWRAQQENEWVAVPGSALDPFVPADSSRAPGDPGPFSMSDPGQVAAILGDAGFSDISVEPFDADVVLSVAGLSDAVRFAMTTGPSAARLREADDVTKARVSEALARRLAPFVASDRVALRGAVWLATATRPPSAG